MLLFAAFSLSTTDTVPPSPSLRDRHSVPASTFQYLHYNHDEVDRFMAAVQTIHNFVLSCTSSGFGISVNGKYVTELVRVFLKYATSAVEQLAGNISSCNSADVGRSSGMEGSDWSMVEETQNLLMTIVKHATMLRDCLEVSAISVVN